MLCSAAAGRRTHSRQELKSWLKVIRQKTARTAPTAASSPSRMGKSSSWVRRPAIQERHRVRHLSKVLEVGSSDIAVFYILNTAMWNDATSNSLQVLQ